MELRVTKYGEPVLRQKGEAVQEFDSELEKFAADMIETMYAHEGIGLAAQQVDRPIMLCVVDLQLGKREPDFFYRFDGKQPPLDLFMPLVLVNPTVTTVPDHVVEREEGCLSFPEVYGVVQRPDAVSVNFQDLKGAPHTIECNGLLSRVIQHEVDHLNGVLYIDHMDKTTLKKIDVQLKQLKRESREFLRDL